MLTRLIEDRRGVSAIEFAMLAPVLIILYFGLAELCQGYMSQKRMSHAASAIADLVSQTTVVTKDNLEDIFSIGPMIMQPFPASSLTYKVSSVTVDANGAARVDWSLAGTTTAAGTVTQAVGLKPNDIVAIPDDLIEKDESLIMAETNYHYASPVRYFMPNLTHFTSTFYLRPRTVDKVLCSDCPKT